MDVIIISITLLLAGISLAGSSISYFTSSKNKTVLLISVFLSLLASGLILTMLFTIENIDLRFVLIICTLLVCLTAGISNLIAIVNMQDASRTAYISLLTSLLAIVGAFVGTGSLFLLKQDKDRGNLPHVKGGPTLIPPQEFPNKARDLLNRNNYLTQL